MWRGLDITPVVTLLEHPKTQVINNKQLESLKFIIKYWETHKIISILEGANLNEETRNLLLEIPTFSKNRDFPLDAYRSQAVYVVFLNKISNSNDLPLNVPVKIPSSLQTKVDSITLNSIFFISPNGKVNIYNKGLKGKTGNGWLDWQPHFHP